MADIKQAAKWMLEGKRVTRPSVCDKGSFFSADIKKFIHYDSSSLGRVPDALEPSDLLADDWELAE